MAQSLITADSIRAIVSFVILLGIKLMRQLLNKVIIIVGTVMVEILMAALLCFHL
jgi:hypothetical protein